MGYMEPNPYMWSKKNSRFQNIFPRMDSGYSIINQFKVNVNYDDMRQAIRPFNTSIAYITWVIFLKVVFSKKSEMFYKSAKISVISFSE